MATDQRFTLIQITKDNVEKLKKIKQRKGITLQAQVDNAVSKWIEDNLESHSEDCECKDCKEIGLAAMVDLITLLDNC